MMTTVREFGGFVDVDLAPDQVNALRAASLDVKVRMGLREVPLVARRIDGGVQLKARHVAGFVQVGNKNIEIAPKFLRPDDDSRWRDAFLAILAHLGQIASTPRVAGAWGGEGLPDLMGLVIGDALDQAATEGLPRRYHDRREGLQTLRGQLDIERLWHRIAEPEVLPCRFDEFSEDTPAARLLKWAASELAELVSSPPLAAQLRSHVDAMPRVTNELPSELVRDRIVVPPQYGYLTEAIDVASMLASGSALSMANDEDAPARAFLWNTASVFEDFVFEVCRAAMVRLGGTATKSSYRLAEPIAGPERSRQASIPTTPDVVVTSRRWTGLIDAKYKTLQAHPKTSDVYQVMAGGRLLKTDAIALAMPAWRDFQHPRSWALKTDDSPATLHALPIDLNLMARPRGFAELAGTVASWLETWRMTGGRSVVKGQASVAKEAS